MNKIFILTLALFIILTLPAAADEPTAEQSRINAIETAQQSTVKVMVNLSGLATGFFVSEDYILTSYHVVGDNKEVHVSGVRGGIFVDVVSVDTRYDLALVKAPYKGIPLKLAKRVVTGQDAYMTGHPKLMDTMVTSGIVSRVYNDSNKRWSIIDISAYEGSSGSPIINSDGEVIGLLKGQYEDDTSFMLAIHIDDIRRFLERNGIHQ
jgi:S1-C subfamily serine protease